MPFSSVLETAIGRLLYSLRGRDVKLFLKAAPFAALSTPLITVCSPDYGQLLSTVNHSPVTMRAEHTQIGSNLFPALTWTVSEELKAQVESWVVVVEDPDAPLPSPVVHGLYYGIPAEKTSLDNTDMGLVGGTLEAQQRAGFQYGRNRHRTVWAGPKPVMGHGSHRYFFQVAGIRGVQWNPGQPAAKTERLTKDELVGMIQGHVVAWGVWVGTFERR